MPEKSRAGRWQLQPPPSQKDKRGAKHQTQPGGSTPHNVQGDSAPLPPPGDVPPSPPLYPTPPSSPLASLPSMNLQATLSPLLKPVIPFKESGEAREPARQGRVSLCQESVACKCFGFQLKPSRVSRSLKSERQGGPSGPEEICKQPDSGQAQRQGQGMTRHCGESPGLPFLTGTPMLPFACYLGVNSASKQSERSLACKPVWRAGLAIPVCGKIRTGADHCLQHQVEQQATVCCKTRG